MWVSGSEQPEQGGERGEGLAAGCLAVSASVSPPADEELLDRKRFGMSGEVRGEREREEVCVWCGRRGGVYAAGPAL